MSLCESVFDSLDPSTSKWMAAVDKNGVVWSLSVANRMDSPGMYLKLERLKLSPEILCFSLSFSPLLASCGCMLVGGFGGSSLCWVCLIVGACVELGCCV